MRFSVQQSTAINEAITDNVYVMYHVGMYEPGMSLVLHMYTIQQQSKNYLKYTI
jgi:hypothetical protein